MTEPYTYDLATAVCPGCDEMVVMPAYVSEGPPICGTCGSEVPDPRRVVATVASEGEAEPEEETGAENKRYTRGSLLTALRDTVAEKGIAAINKRTPPSLRG